MATRRDEIYLRVLKNISRLSAANEWNIFQYDSEGSGTNDIIPEQSQDRFAPSRLFWTVCDLACNVGQ